MSVEKIIQQINKDAESEIKVILKNAQQQARAIIEDAKKEAKAQSEKIILAAEKQSEKLRKILVAKAKQEIKHELMNAKETVITESFLKAYSQIPKIKEEEYKGIVTKLMKSSIVKIGWDCKIFVSREIDAIVANNLNLKVAGSADAAGGFIAVSGDGRIKLNNTFEAIINRKKDRIRVKVGKILFS